MSTLFNKCEVCLGASPQTPPTSYSDDQDKMEILKKKGLPTEIAIKIIQLTYSCVKCINCDKVLCESHKYIRDNIDICESCYYSAERWDAALALLSLSLGETRRTNPL